MDLDKEYVPPIDVGAAAPTEPAEQEPSSSSKKDGAGQLRSDLDDDWETLSAGLRQRREEQKREQLQRKQGEGDEEEDDDVFDEPVRRSAFGRQCVIMFAAFFLAVVVVGGHQLWSWYHPAPVSCTLELVRPQKFKLDVTDFFHPRVSAALQLVLTLKNTNLLRSMLLEHCKLTVFEADTGLKLGSVQHSGAVLKPFATQSVTLSLKDLAGSLPQEEQRRLAGVFLANKALLLTIVATASSRIPIKGSKASEVSSNSSKRLDLASLTKEPFFQRAPPPPPEEGAEATDRPHDVPNA